VRPGEIYLAFDGAGGRRAFVVVSREELNRGAYVLAVPFTSRKLDVRRGLPNCVYVPGGSVAGLPDDCVAQAEALTLLRKIDLVQPVRTIGTLGATTMAALIAAVGYVLESECVHGPPAATGPAAPPPPT
jgi:mRNA-degrading endonuclease toxin of MazEF toxin-antitoxin module